VVYDSRLAAPSPVPQGSERPAWDPAGIGRVAFFLSILPAGILQAINYERLGAPERVRWTLVRNLGAAAAFFGAAFFTELPHLFFAVFHGLAYFYFRESQRGLFAAHLARGGARASFRRPVVYSIVGLVALVVGLFAHAYYLTIRDEQRFREAVGLLESRQYKPAEDLFRLYRRSNPDDIASYYNVALIYLWQADTARALQELREGLARDPSDTAATSLLAELASAHR
jgi:tetratricopeptide (TPR) repeat protein